MKIELTIKADYVPGWKSWEGIRELVQNGKDAETEFNAPLKVSRYKRTLRIENEGVILPHEALLLGHTTKSHRDDLIGSWGEGLKLGVLALVREGRSVKIRSGEEVWIPAIEKSGRFGGAEVLVFDIQKGRKSQDRVRVEVELVDDDEWDNIKHRFLFLAKSSEDTVIETTYGALLLGEKFKSRVYVKGIYVNSDHELNYGYNYLRANLDRDRRMVDGWDKKYYNARIWKEAVAKRPELFESFIALAEEDKEDLKGLDDYAVDDLDDEVLDQVAAKFSGTHGDKAIPVQNLSESEEMEHLGRKGVVVSKQMQSLLKPKIGAIEVVKESLRSEVTAAHSWHDLTDKEKTNLKSAITLIAEVEPCSLDEIDVVDFRSEGLLGQYKDGRQLLARRNLGDRDETLCTLIHEVAHRAGGDGVKSHIDRLQDIWSGVVSYLRDIID